jgi:ketosteroid isomerase-like protein
MSLELPPPIDAYVAANAQLDVDRMLNTFAADAVFRDNGSVYRGHAEIRTLLDEAVVAVRAIFEPDTLRQEDGVVVVEGPVHGDFKGSPIRFTYRFMLGDGVVRTLEVTA